MIFKYYISFDFGEIFFFTFDYLVRILGKNLCSFTGVIFFR